MERRVRADAPLRLDSVAEDHLPAVEHDPKADVPHARIAPQPLVGQVPTQLPHRRPAGLLRLQLVQFSPRFKYLSSIT